MTKTTYFDKTKLIKISDAVDDYNKLLKEAAEMNHTETLTKLTILKLYYKDQNYDAFIKYVNQLKKEWIL